MSKGTSFDSLYPGTYIKAGQFDGKDVTLTFKKITRELLSDGSGGEESAVIVEFNETELKWVMVKTNAVCARALWGDDYSKWIGHRITLHAVPDTSGLSESGKCIRVLGSPEIDKPLKFRARLGRKMVTQTLVPTATAKPPASVDPAIGDGDGDADVVDDDIGFTDDAPHTAEDDTEAPSGASGAEIDSGVADGTIGGFVPGRGAKSAQGELA